jgi:hypothetical protein
MTNASVSGMAAMTHAGVSGMTATVSGMTAITHVGVDGVRRAAKAAERVITGKALSICP